jgi:hypothetical protein
MSRRGRNCRRCVCLSITSVRQDTTPQFLVLGIRDTGSRYMEVGAVVCLRTGCCVYCITTHIVSLLLDS